MFVAVRDIRFARGRFALMGSVIALLTLMVVLLTGLTAGLSRASISAITDLPADHLVFAAPPHGASLSFSNSQVPESTVSAWSHVSGVESAEPLSITMSRASIAGDEIGSAVAVFAVSSGSHLAPSTVKSGSIVLSTDAADELGAHVGDEIAVAGSTLTVTAVSGDASYSHTDVIWVDRADVPAQSGATVIALTTRSGTDFSAADSRLGTRTVSTDDAVSAIGSYTAENSSLQLMRALLLAISALVVGAFFTVWTVQRSADIAVLKALGSSTGYLLRDALGQALILLVAGTAVGAAVATGLGILASSAVPFEVTLGSVLMPAGAMVLLGLIGAALSLRRVTSVDPLTALGSAR